MSLKQRVKQLSNNLPLMENREKAELDNILNKVVTINDYGFMNDGDNKPYVAFTVEEDKQNFYFGGQVLTEDMMELEADGYRDEIQKDGLPILLSKKTSKNKREYTTVTYYPN